MYRANVLIYYNSNLRKVWMRLHKKLDNNDNFVGSPLCYLGTLLAN